MNTFSKSVLFLLVCCFLTAISEASAQEISDFKVSGFVAVDKTGQAIDSVYVSIPLLKKSTFSDSTGFFKIVSQTDYDSISVIFHKPGFRLFQVRVGGSGPNVRLVSLSTFDAQSSEVPIIGERRKTQGLTYLKSKEIQKLPSVFGEPDFFKILSYRSGFVNIGENSVGLSVRGGEPSQNLILLDDTPVFNVSHLFGFMSNISTDAISELQAYKGGFPADKGGRISSVLQLDMREGNRKSTSVVGGLGVLASRISIDGPIIKDKLTYLIAGRRTFLDAFIPYLNNRKSERDRLENPIPNYYFGDGNLHLDWYISLKDKLSAKTFGATDRFSYDNLDYDLIFDWQNRMADLTWTHYFPKNATLKTSTSYSNYKYALSNEVPGFSIGFASGVDLLRFKTHFTKTQNNRNEWGIGATIERYSADIAVLDAGGSIEDLLVSTGEARSADLLSAFASYKLKMAENFELQTGLRLSGFKGDEKLYGTIEPRALFIYSKSSDLNFFLSYDRMAQYLHQLYGAGFSLPVDIWYPSTQNLKPQRSHQLAIGTNYHFGDGFLLKYEVYYKAMDNQPELIDGALLIGSGRLDEQTVLGFGNAFAACELELQKNKGNLQGWLSYTLGRTRRWGYPSINGGDPFPPRQDVRHNLSAALRQRLNPKISLSTTFTYRSGLMAWLPKQRAHFQNTGSGELGSIIPIYETRNNVRMPAFMRWDVGCIWYFSKKQNQNLTFSLTNVTNRRNPFFYYLDPIVEEVSINDINVQVPTRIESKPISLFPILPAVTWNFEF